MRAISSRTVVLLAVAPFFVANGCISETPSARRRADAAADAPVSDGGQVDRGNEDGQVADRGPADAAVDAVGDAPKTGPALCPDSLPPSWIFCEDFESGSDLNERFFEYDDNDGDFRVVATQGASGSHAMEAVFQQSEVGAGRVSVAFGRNPMVYGGRPHYRTTEDFTELYWRMRVKHQAGWPDVAPAKLSRATAFAKSNWGQAMIAHLWSGDNLDLIGDPATCVTGSTVACNKYNDFDNLDWLGIMHGKTQIFSANESGRWVCIEGHVKLNTPGQSDGIFEFWIDDQLENARSDLDWRGNWSAYGLNLVSFENYWNSGAVQELRRWFDDLAIATTRIGCD